MKESKEYIQLKFNCQEDPESMEQSSNGEFCTSCQKEVIDFTSMTFAEIQKIRATQPEMCGKFRPEQIDPSLRPIEAPKMRSLAFLSTILLSLNFGSVSAQSTVDPKIEQAQNISNAPNLTPEEAKRKSESGQHISMSKATVNTTERSEAEPKRKKIKRHKKLFWSWQFPFVHRRRSNFRVKF